MADRAHSTSRRALLAGLSATTVMYLPVYANGVHPDAALLSREPMLAQLAQAEEEALSLSWSLEGRAHDLADTRAAKLTAEWQAALVAAKDEVGFTRAEAIVSSAMRAITEACEAIVLLPAQSLDGLCMKARYAEHCDGLAESIVDDLLAIHAAMHPPSWKAET